MKKIHKKQIVIFLLIGLFGGVVNGLFGAGAGLLLVPMIKKVEGVEDKVAHATTLACVMMMCVVSSVVFWVNNQVELSVLLPCLLGSLVGSVFGTFLLQKIKNKCINLIFSFIL